jgi:membrane-associated phospholipid phosphatase
MPSLHFAWAFWTFLVLFPHLKRTWAKIAIAVYPWATLFAIVVTANHYWIDALGGALALVGGYGLAVATRQVGLRLRRRQVAAESTP